MSDNSQKYTPIAPNGSPVNDPSKKRRNTRACDLCRIKKAKCDILNGSKSCRNCILIHEGCTFNTNVKKRGPPKGYVTSLEDKLGRIEDLLSKIAADQNEKTVTEKDSNNSKKNETEHKKYLQWGKKDISTIETSNNIKTPKDYQERSEKKIFRDLFNRLLLPMGLQLQLNIQTGILNLNRTESTDFDMKINPFEDAKRANRTQPNETINDIEDWIWRTTGIDKNLSDRLLKVYFIYIHPATPILNKRLFLEEYRGIRPILPFPSLLISVYLAAIKYITVCQRFDDAENLNNNEPWNLPKNIVEQLTTRLFEHYQKRYLPTLASLQAIVIAQMHSFGSNKWGVDWILCFNGIQMGQDLGLHRSSEEINVPQEEKETRRRVWWSLYVLDRWLAAESGRPFTIVDEDCNEKYPSENVDWDEMMDSMTKTDQHLPRFPSLDEETAKKCKSKKIPLYQPFIQMIRLSKILGMILQNLYTVQAKIHCAKHGSDSIVGYLDNALSNWRTGLPPLLKISSAGKVASNNENHYSLLSMTGIISLSYYTLLILLHRPFIRSDTDNERSKISSQTSLAICTSAATKIVEISESMSYRDFLLVSWGYAIYPSMTATTIHLFNTQSPDKKTVHTAKSKIIQGLAIIDKLNEISPFRDTLKNSLRNRLLHSKICIQDQDFADKLRFQEKAKNQSHIKKMTETDRNKCKQVSSIHKVPKKKADEDTLPTLLQEYNWLDELQVPPLSQTSNQAHYPTPPSGTENNDLQQHLKNMEDLFSIRQFGFNIPAFDSGLRQAQNRLLDYDTIFPQVPYYLTPAENQEQNFIQYTNSALFNNMASFPYDWQHLDQDVISNTEPVLSYFQSNNTSNNLPPTPIVFADFENNTRNRFWGIPDSTNMDDWNFHFTETGLQ